MPEGQRVGVAVVTSDTGVLVVKNGDHVSFPTAEITSGELVTDTIARTVSQQTGVSVTLGKLLGTRFHPRSGLTAVYMSASPVTTPSLSEDAYMPLDEALEAMPDMPPQARYHLQAALAEKTGLLWDACRDLV